MSNVAVCVIVQKRVKTLSRERPLRNVPSSLHLLTFSGMSVLIILMCCKHRRSCLRLKTFFYGIDNQNAWPGSKSFFCNFLLSTPNPTFFVVYNSFVPLLLILDQLCFPVSFRFPQLCRQLFWGFLWEANWRLSIDFIFNWDQRKEPTPSICCVYFQKKLHAWCDENLWLNMFFARVRRCCSRYLILLGFLL